MRNGEFYSKGKFLLSGEYYVLYGAKALAVPLKFGQTMVVNEIPRAGMIEWETFVLNKPWFKADYSMKDMSIMDSSSEKTAFFIRGLLQASFNLRPGLQNDSRGFSIRNYLDFDIRWGMGSSSSLISNLAYWLDIDPYFLYRSVFQGSGYDVFCARANGPMTFQLKQERYEIHEVPFNPAFLDHLFFIYLGRKQDTQESVGKFKSRPVSDEGIIRRISNLTDDFIKSADLEDFLSLIRIHEDAISAAIGIPTVKQDIFPDFNGEIKSLGAWGGDFVMAATAMSSHETRDYFFRKGLNVIFGWNDIIF